MHMIKMVALHITRACSHRCPFCYATSVDASVAAPPDHSTLLRVIDAVADSKVEELVFAGGDPCAYPQILELAAAGKARGMVTTVLSNTHRYRASSMECTSVIDCFETTFHGPTAIEHDLIALREGAFESVVANLQALGRTAKCVGAIYNITPYNARQLRRTIHELVGTYGIPVDHLVLQRIVPQGRARTTSKFAVGRSQAVAALEDLESVLAQHPMSVFFEDPFPLCLVPERFQKYLSRCEWGFTRAAVDHLGNLSRCGADPRYRLGNILQVPLLELWNTLPILSAYRSKAYLPAECQCCNLLERCGGGCALSCEIEGEFGVDYLYYEHSKRTDLKPRELACRPARREDLSDILRIEWASFPDFPFRFSPDGILRWHAFNPSMFVVLEDSLGRLCGYRCLVPLTDQGLAKVTQGRACSLQELEFGDVLGPGSDETKYWHIEAMATIADVRSRAGRTLVRNIGEFLVDRAEIVTASPITYVGTKLCTFFGFKKIASEMTKGKLYHVYAFTGDPLRLKATLDRF